MIEIRCTKRQKEVIMESLLNPNGCLWLRKQMFCVYDPKASCKNYFEKKIKWILPEKKIGGKQDEGK